MNTACFAARAGLVCCVAPLLYACVSATTYMRPITPLPQGQRARVTVGGGGGGGLFGGQGHGELTAAYRVTDEIEVVGFGKGAGVYLPDSGGWTYVARAGLVARQSLEIIDQTSFGWEAGAAYTTFLGGIGDQHQLGLLIGIPVHQELSPGLYLYSNPSVHIGGVVAGRVAETPIVSEADLPLGIAWQLWDHLILVGEVTYLPLLEGAIGSVGLMGTF